jgi:hypothetical protein
MAATLTIANSTAHLILNSASAAEYVLTFESEFLRQTHRIDNIHQHISNAA